MNNAVIDIGTNTVILLVAASSGKKKIRVLRDRAVITRLGRGLTENHFLLSDAMQRTKKVLSDFRKECEGLKVKKIVAVGTAACRIAANTQVFADTVKAELGFKIEILSPEQEAENTFLAAWKDFGSAKTKLIVVDIGGGSTEVVTGPVSRLKTAPQTVMSLPLGTVRLTEEYVHSDPIDEDQFQRLKVTIRQGVRDELDDFYPKDFNPADYTIVATAGTATTLATLDKKLKVYRPEKVHGSILKKGRLQEMIDQLAPLPVKERQKLPGMEPLRADVILAGAILLNEILDFFGKSEVVISDRGLRYGVFYKKFVK